MGTTSEWTRVLLLAAIYGSLALLWEGIKSESRFAELPGWFLMGFLGGMMIVFEWRVLHGGIGAVFAVLVLGLFVIGFARRRARKRTEVSSKAP